MKAKIKPRIDLENRTRLEKVIPLETPFIINIDPSDKCNFQCKFCPTGDRKLMQSIKQRNFGYMEYDLYKKIIEDICEFDSKIKVLRLYKDGEPLLNPNFSRMVKYAKSSGCCERVDTTTNGSLLNPERSLEIIDAGIDRINISVEGMNEAQYLNFSKYKINFDEYIKNIKFLYENKKQCEIIVKINGDMLTDKEKKQFYETFGDIADGVYIESVMQCWHDFEIKDLEVNNKVGIYRQKLTTVDVCPYVFYSFSINSDGTASTCFLDWKHEMIIGNVKNESVKDIWNGQKLNEYRIKFLKKERRLMDICSNCGQLTHGMPDNIDLYADELLKRIEK